MSPLNWSHISHSMCCISLQQNWTDKVSTLKLALFLDRHLHRNLRMWVVIIDDEIFKLEGCNVILGGVITEGKGGERSGFTFQLFVQRINVVQVDVRISQGVDKFSNL